MSDQLTAEALNEIRGRERVASPGPWFFTDSNGNAYEELCFTSEDDESVPVLQEGLIGYDQSAQNWNFACCAREDIPRLLAHADWAAKEIERLVSMLFQCGRHSPDCPTALNGGSEPDYFQCTCGWDELQNRLWPTKGQTP